MTQEPGSPSPLIEDIRLLKLAELYETAYEGFILQMATQVVDDPEVRKRLMRLVDPKEDHAGRIADHLERLNGQLGENALQHVMLGALLDVVEIERSAHDFYRTHAGRIHDPEVRALFDEIAEQEAEHARIAEEAAKALRRRLGLPPGLPMGYRRSLIDRLRSDRPARPEE